MFVDNPEDVCRFIATLKTCLEDRIPVYVSLRDVTEIDYDSIVVLLSVMIRFKSSGLYFNGNYPKNRRAARLLIESTFFKRLREEFTQSDEYELKGGSSILTHGMKAVDSELGQKIITAASVTVWNEKRRCKGVQSTLIELMQNTNNHASLDRTGDRHWWLSVKHVNEENLVAFSFVDYGVGVFHSLRNKPTGNAFAKAFQRLYEKARYGTDAEVLRLIFHGELQKTSSGESYRGKGLKCIHDALTRNGIANLAMITNNVYFNSRTNQYTMLRNAFDGTFVYWEINSTTLSDPYVDDQDCK